MLRTIEMYTNEYKDTTQKEISLVVSVLISFTVERLGWESSILSFVGQRFQVLLHG